MLSLAGFPASIGTLVMKCLFEDYLRPPRIRHIAQHRAHLYTDLSRKSPWAAGTGASAVNGAWLETAQQLLILTVATVPNMTALLARKRTVSPLGSLAS